VRDLLGLGAFVLLITLPGWSAFVLLLAGEIAERYLFFRAVDAPKMPGMPRS
jgi:DMSO reductase anchor subunit